MRSQIVMTYQKSKKSYSCFSRSPRNPGRLSEKITALLNSELLSDSFSTTTATAVAEWYRWCGHRRRGERQNGEKEEVKKMKKGQQHGGGRSKMAKGWMDGDFANLDESNAK
ncbi:hypothetical protein TNCV_1783651 [Trichonephila clavipes]|nr:hypothetical protein TNCV_1783651 [Trichonephila clavipes]